MTLLNETLRKEIVLYFLDLQRKMASWEVNEKGEYKPCFGYTIVSMLNDPGNELKSIETFLSSSILSRYFAPLPHNTYHITLYNVYPMKKEPIPPVKRWMLAEEETLPKNGFLPEIVLKHQHELAVEMIKKHLGENYLRIKEVILDVENVIKIRVKLDDRDESVLKSLREDLAKIYEHPDASLKFHITLAYLYKPAPTSGAEFDRLKEDVEQLKGMVQKFEGFELNKHNVYLFDSMVNFMPFN